MMVTMKNSCVCPGSTSAAADVGDERLAVKVMIKMMMPMMTTTMDVRILMGAL